MLRRISLAALVACLAAAQPAAAHHPTAPAGPQSAQPATAVTSGKAFEGKHWLRHADYFPSGRADDEPMLTLDDGTVLELDFAGHAPELAPGSRVRVRGERRGKAIAVADGSAQTVAPASAPLAATVRTKRVAIVLMNFSNDTSQPYSAATAYGVAFTNANSVANYYDDNSWGGTAVNGDVYGWYTIANTNATCDYSAWASAADSAANAAGANLGAYDHVVYAFPRVTACSWSGLAYMPGRTSWLNGPGAMSLRTMGHELGHNFGTHHSSTWSCTEAGVRVSLTTSTSACTSNEYGDPFTIMGASTYWHTNFALGNFGWLTAANTQTVTGTGDYVVKPLEAYDPTGVQSLRIARAGGSYMTLEFRQPGLSTFDGFAATDPAVNGVIVRLADEYAVRSRSQLVDTTPSTTSFGDAPLAAGRTLVDPLTGVALTTVSIAPSGATVHVDFGSTSDTSAPGMPGSLSATALDTSRISLAWIASADNVGVTGYRVRRGGVLLATVASPGYTDAGLSPATAYSYSVTAIDAAGNESPAATASATTLATADSVAPSAPTNLRATLGKGRKVALAWTASSDNVGVAGYRIFRNAGLLTSTSGTSYNDTLPAKMSSPTYYVVAYDAAGNTSPPSASVTAR